MRSLPAAGTGGAVERRRPDASPAREAVSIRLSEIQRAVERPPFDGSAVRDQTNRLAALALTLRRSCQPTNPMPNSIIAQVSASGTAAMDTL